MTTILGLDASTVAIGYALLDDDKLLQSGTLTLKGETMRRIKQGYDDVFSLLCQLPTIDVVAFEIPASKLHFETIYKLGWIEGAVIVAAQSYSRSVELMPVTPDDAKIAMTGHARAGKGTVMFGVNALFGREITDDNEADAVAIAWAARCKIRLEAMT